MREARDSIGAERRLLRQVSQADVARRLIRLWDEYFDNPETTKSGRRINPDTGEPLGFTERGKVFPKLRVSRSIILRPKRLTTVMVSTDRLVLMSIQPNEELYTKHNIVSMKLIVEVRPNVFFKLVVSNDGNRKYHLTKNQTLSHLLPHLGAVVPTPISLLEILVGTEDTSVTCNIRKG